MDQRGYTTDPNSLALTEPEWWKNIGPSQRPSPYATASWEYLQDFEVVEQEIELDGRFLDIFDNGRQFSKYLWSLILDGGDDFDLDVLPLLSYDAGLFTETGTGLSTIRTFTFARVSVVDRLASFPGLYELIEVEQEPLQTDTDGLDLELDGYSDATTIKIEREANIGDDTPPGQLLGFLDYQIVENVVSILNWSDIWNDSTPVKMAFKAMVNSLPQCVETITVENTAPTFWKSLGFEQLTKGSTTLVYTKE